MFFLVIVLIPQILESKGQTGFPYNALCPHSSQWSLKAKGFCTNQTLPNYYCLFDVNKQMYTEFCRKTTDFQRPGFQFVMRGEIDGQMCNKTHFQPFKFFSNKSSQCELIKSECTEEGQLVNDDGNHTVDRSCRCDYTKGYNFVTKPLNGCSCIHGKEDCSCYFRSCESGFVSTPDYQCVRKSEWTGNFNCPVIKPSTTITEEDQKKSIIAYNNVEITCKDNESIDLKRRLTVLAGFAIAWNITAIIIVIFMTTIGRQIQDICREVMHVEIEVKLADHETHFHTAKQELLSTRDVIKMKLAKNQNDILSKMQYEGILDSLIEKQILTSNDQDEIQTKPRNKERNHRLLEKIWNKDDTAFTVFIRALRRQNENLADQIENTNIVGTESINAFLEDDYNENIPQYNRELNDKYIRDWQEDDKCFINTSASIHVKEKLKTTNCAFIVGGPGEGKTSIIRHLALEFYREENYDIIPIVMVPLIIRQFYNPNRRQVFVVDDFCGRDRIYEQSIDLWVLPEYTNLFEKIIESEFRIDNQNRKKEDVKILFACNTNVFNDPLFQCLNFYQKYAFNLCKWPLSEHERIGIMKKRYLHVPAGSEVSVKQFQFKGLNFPLLCKLSFGKPADQLHEFFQRPLDCIEKDIRYIKQQHDLKLCALTLLVLFNNGFKEEWFDPNASPQNVKLAVAEVCGDFSLDMSNENSRQRVKETLVYLEKTYLSKAGGVYHIVHSQIFDIAAAICGQIFFDCFINHAGSVFIGDRYRLEAIKNGTDKNVITISPENERRYFNRLVRDLENGDTYSFLHNKQLGFSQYRQKFIKYCNERKSKVVELLNKVKEKENNNEVSSDSTVYTQNIINEKVDDYSYYTELKRQHSAAITCIRKPLIEVILEGYADVVKMLLDMNYDKNEMHAFGRNALYISCLLGHKDIVSLLLEKGVDITVRDHKGRTALYAACKEGHSDVVKLLLTNMEVTECDDEGSSPLHAACTEGHNNVVKMLLDQNANTAQLDNFGRTPIFVACYRGRTDVVKTLLHHNVDITIKDLKGRTPLFAACKKDRLLEAKLLLESGADVLECDNSKRSPLHIAAKHGFNEIVQLLIQHHANITQCDWHGISPLQTACENGHKAIIDLLLQNDKDVNRKDENGNTPLHVACSKGHLDIVSTLLSFGADSAVVDRDKKSALYVSCEMGQTDIVKALICNKQDQALNIIELYDKYEASPLHVVCMKGYLDIAKCLIKFGADVNHCNKFKRSPLYIACQGKHYELVNLLVKKLARVNASDTNKITPLHVACEQGDAPVVRLLLDANADISLCDDSGIFPLHIACQKGHEDVVKILLEKGAIKSVQDKDGRTPIYYATENKFNNIVEILASD